MKQLSAPSDRTERTLEGDWDGASVKAFRVRFEQAGRPTKGGVRFHPGADMAESERLALLMSLKCALVGLPFGGAPGEARAPVTGRGYRVLEARGKWAAPDLLANAGGVIASYFEWREYASKDDPDDEALEAEWAGVIDRAADAVIERAHASDEPIHIAALQLALEQMDPNTRPKASPGA